MSKVMTLDVVYAEPPSAASGRTTVRIADIRRVSSVPSYEHDGAHTRVKMDDDSSLFVKQHESTVTAALNAAD